MRLDSVFVTKETSIEISGKCIHFMTVSVHANASLSCANPSNIIGLLSKDRPLNFMEMNNWGITLVEYK